MSDLTKRRLQRLSLDSYPAPIAADQDGLPFDQDGSDGRIAPIIQAETDAAPNSQERGRIGAGPDAAKPEADPFDVASLRLSQDFASAAGVKPLLKTVPVRKPSKEWFVRTHPDPAYRLPTAVLELKEDRETYLVAPALWPGLAAEPTFSSRLLILAITRQSVPFIWPIRLPGSDGKIDDWSRSALDAADEAKSRWVRVTSNMALGAYQIEVASGQLPEPAWPDATFQEIIRIAFRDKMISDRSHPVLRRLRGEV
jgi:hypothetical protein